MKVPSSGTLVVEPGRSTIAPLAGAASLAVNVPARIARRTRGDDQGAAEHFARRHARAASLRRRAAPVPPDVTSLETTSTGYLVPYSHSIVAGGLLEMS